MRRRELIAGRGAGAVRPLAAWTLTDRCRTDAQPCDGWMTKLAIVASSFVTAARRRADNCRNEWRHLTRRAADGPLNATA